MEHALPLQQLCQQCIEIASEAADEILKVYQSDYTIVKKQDNSPVTTADLIADKIIRKRLLQLRPKLPIISEETAIASYLTRSRYTSYWLIDPLDGTREFIQKNHQFTVNIALIHQHKSVLGVVNAPALGIEYFAYKGGGSYKVTASEKPKKISVNKKILHNKIKVVASRSHKSEQMQSYLTHLAKKYNVERKNKGSSLKICEVAEGSADLYPRLVPTSQWDTAAAQCVLEQAGGYLTTTNMQALLYNTKDSLLNPYFFAFGDRDVDWSKFIGSD